MTYVPRLAQSNHSWLGDGGVVYTTGYRPNTPFADNLALQQLQKPYIDAQIQRRASQSANKVARQTSRQGHVTVYDAVKRQYVSATPEEASFIRDVNKEVAVQRRASQTSKSILDRFGGKTVKVGDKYVAQSQYETARQYINNETARKIGQVEKQHIERLLSKGTPLSPSVIDHNLGLDRAPKSAQESMGIFVKKDVEQALRQKTPLSPSVIDHNLGLDRIAKSARESAEAFKPENIVRQQTIQPR